MAPQFQPYGQDPGQEVRQRWSGSLDDIFNAYQQAKQQAMMQQEKDNAGKRQLAMDRISGMPRTDNMTLDQINRGGLPPTMIGSGPTTTGEPFTQTKQYDSDPAVAALQQAHERYTSSQERGIQKENMGLDLQRSEIEKNKAAAFKDMNPQLKGSMGGMAPTDEQIDTVARDFASGGIPAKDFAQLIGRSSPQDRYRLYGAIKKYNPDYNMADMSLQFAGDVSGRQASARLTEGGSSQVVARAANSAKEQLDTLQEMSDKFPRSDTRFMNTAINAIDIQTHPEATNWRVALNSARAEYATALNRGNSPTEELMKEAKVAIPDNITPRQLPGAIATMRRGLEATVKGQMTPAGRYAQSTSSPKIDPAQVIREMSSQGKSREEIKTALKAAGH